MNISNWSDNTMKLKFKADASDVLIFIIFAIFLFYIVCLGILNFPELASTGHFYGLNPFPALAPSRVLTTLVKEKVALVFQQKNLLKDIVIGQKKRK